ncbi:MAG: hypothetical protein HY220_04485 [Candidatus Sungbacteria bacterium]|uniref:Cohesin domain-containing protein n=1 Tax=Candidatus Sungiibacteriota bacterium TaxID=2750080 RepID=A0A9D6QUA8_9BACT|nr:hypothetical protein [Candidatus Sungbacteria bacterium]
MTNKSWFIFTALVFGFLAPAVASAAELYVTPGTGTFEVGSTFNASIFLDSKGDSINALEVHLIFPPDKLQVVSPSIGQSIIGIWTGQPRFDNQNGDITLQGGIPGGINVSQGLLSTVTFRVKSVGTALVKFGERSKTLLNDGLGTDVLKQTTPALYNLVLPPPAGPRVTSETHPNQSHWYNNSTVILQWTPPASNVGGYSYILSDTPIDSLSDISSGIKNSVVYKNVSDGIHYFHIKAARDGAWGGTTHFAVKIDSTPPADFPVEIIPEKRTARQQPVIQFGTSDALSGMDHYELKIVPLSLSTDASENEAISNVFFLEAQSPYIPQPLALGSYAVIVRAYDQAGNFREEVQHLDIVTTAVQFIQNEGLQIKGNLIIPWLWFWTILGALIAALVLGAIFARKLHILVHWQWLHRKLPTHINEKMEELERYRRKYGGLAILLLVIAFSLFTSHPALAGQEIPPPLVTTVSQNISNAEIFYIGGKTDAASTTVIVYLQNLQDGETNSARIISDSKGDWFYQHPSFLSTGDYLLWVQTQVGEERSPPSPQIQLTVRRTALQFGTSRVSYEALYIILAVILLIVVIGLVAYIVFHGIHLRRKHKILEREVEEAEKAIRDGFLVLKQTIDAELAVIHKVKLSKKLSQEEKAREEELERDIESIKNHIEKEVWDIGRA